MIEQILYHIYARGAKYESAYANPLIYLQSLIFIITYTQHIHDCPDIHN